MGNCLLGGMSDPEAVIKVTTSDGGIMEFYAPITVSFITNEFPGHGIFLSHELFCKPLSQFEELVAGQSYHLLPLNNQPEHPPATGYIGGDNCTAVRQGHVRSRSVPTNPYPPPYRMSLDYQHLQGMRFLNKTSIEPFSCRTSTSNKSSKCSIVTSAGSKSSRFWKVKLVITPQKLMDILSQEARTKELIESVRIVAKCGVSAGGILPASAAASTVSDQWSLSSSGRSACDSSKIDALVVDI
ncbi:uncharacterized protein LOC106767888 [Vigna radiata var. radiata]|uniref:Uncharacterized protein LOC106767888 n=1 Tax=Vigna radiata var. radiata TaxID=3916 RepID=A0A1S3UQY1_VIGRR|nr:uncharacterized protein LOC106767888 [Vigna radiata var. radiata]